MEQINDMLFTYFPCAMCWGFGYLCCPFTLGLSLCCPAICVRDAEQNLRDMITRMNRQKLNKIGLSLSLQKHCGTSWLQVDLTPKDSVLASENFEKNAMQIVSPSNAAIRDEDEDRLITKNFRS